MKAHKCLLVVVTVFLAANLSLINYVHALQEESPAKASNVEAAEKLVPDLTATPDSQDSKCENCQDGTCEDCQSGECKQNSENVDEVATASDSGESRTNFVSTHKQTSAFSPNIDGKQANLTTFRLNPQGQIVACVVPKDVSHKRLEKQDGVEDESPQPEGYVQIYSPEFELLDQFGLPFAPSAVDIDKSGNMFVAGSGHVCKMSSDGKILQMSQAPNLINVDTEEMLKEALEAAQERNKQLQEFYGNQIESLQEQIEELEAIDEGERTNSQESNLKRLKSQLKTYEQIVEQNKIEVDEESLKHQLTSNSDVTAIAVTDNDVYVATSANSGSGYEVYRTTLDFKDPVRILKRLRGCCGQMDIYAADNQVFVAENTNFQVGIYDRDGKKVSSFGQRLRKDNQGFGSCCNPMNVLCCPNGDILTAESSIGKIKRFNSKGEMTGYVGRARIGGGCKHVALGFDEKLDRYYVQYEDNNQICVLSPKTDAASPKDPKIAELGKRLTAGKWQLAGTKAVADQVVGIGVALDVNDEGELLVKDVVKGAPAEKRLKKGDVIVGIGTSEGIVETKGMDLNEVAELLRGEPRTRVLLKVRSQNSDKVLRRSINRVRLQLVDGDWIVAENQENPFGDFDSEALTNMRVLDFKDDGTLRVEMENNPFGMRVKGWVATQAEGDTLMLDMEDEEEVIVYRVKVKFTGDETADISITYDGLGEEGKFRSYELGKDETLTSNQLK